MKLTKILAAALAASTIAGSAVAADLPSRKAPIVAPVAMPVFTWTGFYVGVNVGYAFGGSNTFTSIGAPIAGAGPFGVAQSLAMGNTYTVSGGSKGDGFIGGGQLGFNYQMGSFVAGLEADIQALAASRAGGSSGVVSPVPGFPAESYIGAVTNTKKTEWLGTLRGRLGLLATPSFLLYGTGGLAFGGVKMANAYWAFNAPGGYTVAATGAGASSGTRLGWTIGAGAEWKFAQNWSAKLEYLYYDLGSQTASQFTSQLNPAVFWAGSATSIRTKFDGHVVRAGLNYQFGGSTGPVVAKY